MSILGTLEKDQASVEVHPRVSCSDTPKISRHAHPIWVWFVLKSQITRIHIFKLNSSQICSEFFKDWTNFQNTGRHEIFHRLQAAPHGTLRSPRRNCCCVQLLQPSRHLEGASAQTGASTVLAQQITESNCHDHPPIAEFLLSYFWHVCCTLSVAPHDIHRTWEDEETCKFVRS